MSSTGSAPSARRKWPLWPEHFDVGIAFAEVNFGAIRLLTEAPDVGSLVDFFHVGAARAAADPPRAGQPH